MNDDNRILADLAERSRLADVAEHASILAELTELRASLDFIRNYIEEKGQHLEEVCEHLEEMGEQIDIVRTSTVENRERIGILEAQLASLSRRLDQLFTLTEKQRDKKRE